MFVEYLSHNLKLVSLVLSINEEIVEVHCGDVVLGFKYNQSLIKYLDSVYKFVRFEPIDQCLSQTNNQNFKMCKEDQRFTVQ